MRSMPATTFAANGCEHRLHSAPSSLRSSSNTIVSAPLPISFSAKLTWISLVPS